MYGEFIIGERKMDKYKKLKCVEGLIRSLDEQYYRMDQNKEPVPISAYKSVTNQYYNSILQLLQKEETKEDNSIPEVTDTPSSGEPHTRG